MRGEYYLGEALGLAADVSPGLSLQPEVSLLDSPLHVAGGVSPGPRVEWRPATQHCKLKLYRMKMTTFSDFVSNSLSLSSLSSLGRSLLLTNQRPSLNMLTNQKQALVILTNQRPSLTRMTPRLHKSQLSL